MGIRPLKVQQVQVSPGEIPVRKISSCEDDQTLKWGHREAGESPPVEVLVI